MGFAQIHVHITTNPGDQKAAKHPQQKIMRLRILPCSIECMAWNIRRSAHAIREFTVLCTFYLDFLQAVCALVFELPQMLSVGLYQLRHEGLWGAYCGVTSCAAKSSSRSNITKQLQVNTRVASSIRALRSANLYLFYAMRTREVHFETPRNNDAPQRLATRCTELQSSSTLPNELNDFSSSFLGKTIVNPAARPKARKPHESLWLTSSVASRSTKEYNAALDFS